MIQTRRATKQDIEGFKAVVIESVLELCKDFYSSTELQSLLAQYPGKELYEKWLQERVLVVAEDGDQIVGFAQYFPPNNSIEAVHVLPSHIKKGVGKMLMAELEEIAKEQGAKKIMLDSSLNAVGFYDKCGYIKKQNIIFKCNDGVDLRVVNYEKVLYS